MKTTLKKRRCKQQLLLIFLVQTALIFPLSVPQAVAQEGEEHTSHASTALNSLNNTLILLKLIQNMLIVMVYIYKKRRIRHLKICMPMLKKQG